jgi:hypothetical protein
MPSLDALVGHFTGCQLKLFRLPVGTEASKFTFRMYRSFSLTTYVKWTFQLIFDSQELWLEGNFLGTQPAMEGLGWRLLNRLHYKHLHKTGDGCHDFFRQLETTTMEFLATAQRLQGMHNGAASFINVRDWLPSQNHGYITFRNKASSAY